MPKSSQSNEPEKQLPSQRKNYKLQNFGDYVGLINDTINAVLNGEISPKEAHCVGVLTSYGIQAIRESTGGKQLMSVFLQEMHKSRIKIESMSPEQVDRFLLGDEEARIDVLQSMETNGLIEVEAEIVPKQTPKPKLDTKLLGKMTGIEPDQVRDVLAGEKIELTPKVNAHEWTMDIAKQIRFCINCGLERQRLNSDDATAPCSQEWGLH